MKLVVSYSVAACSSWGYSSSHRSMFHLWFILLQPPCSATSTGQDHPRGIDHALRGAPVSTQDGISLGVLDDLVFDPTDGRILMVIVVAGGRFGLGGRFTALPWSMIQQA